MRWLHLILTRVYLNKKIYIHHNDLVLKCLFAELVSIFCSKGTLM